MAISWPSQRQSPHTCDNDSLQTRTCKPNPASMCRRGQQSIARRPCSQALSALGSPAPHHLKMFMSAMEMMQTVSGPSALSSDSFL